MFILNPIIISVILLCVLCLCRVNVLLALLVSAIVAGKVAGMHAGQIMDVFINGMGQNSETALSYILLGTFAAAMAHTRCPARARSRRCSGKANYFIDKK